MAKLYRYQERVYEALKRGRNVIIQAPTGAGKTRAALYPYFENLSRYSEEKYRPDTPLPLTCRYAVPMRVLASQFEREHRDYFAKLDQKRATDLRDRYEDKLGLRLPAVQTGETPEDPEFESPLTFCTIDQLLASFIGTPFSLGPRLANLNVGAVAGSYLILDEFHLYPLGQDGGARTTTLAMLRLLGNFCRFVLMTATFSDNLLDGLARLLDAEVVRVTDKAELDELMRGRRREIRLSAEPMTPEAILAAHDAARARGAGATLVVCNTVARAQDIYLRLRRALEERGIRDATRLQLLHSRFTPEDRREKSERLEEWLGEGAWKDGRYQGMDTLVVATQVVEVGLNISAGVLHTEIAPANSVVQRAGRCARFAGQFGEVVVYPIPAREEGKVSYRPYGDALCQTTWAALATMGLGADRMAAPFGFAEEQALVDAVHTAEDRRMIERFAEEEQQIARAITERLNTHDYGSASELIRNVTSVSVIIHDEPDAAITTKPFTWQSFQLHPGTLQSAWQKLAARRDGEWVMKQLVPGGGATGQTEDDNDREPVYSWEPIGSDARVPGALRIALPTALAAYDAELGFRLVVDEEPSLSTWMSAPVAKPGTKGKRSGGQVGKQGSYVEHITGLMGAYDWSVRRELAWVAGQLEETLGLPVKSVDEAVRLAIACHDIGKLAVDWQRWAHEWQALLIKAYGQQYAVRAGREFLAKTDRLADWRAEKELQATLRAKRPPHACAGAVAGGMLIGQRLVRGETQAQLDSGLALARAVISAIARHHAPTATGYDAVVWDDTAREMIAAALRACRLPDALDGLDLRARKGGEVDGEWLITATADSRADLLATWLGFVIVRALRLCDQRAEREW